MTHRRWTLAAALAGGLLHAGCSKEAALPNDPAEVSVTMDEYSFALHGSARPGRVVFDFRNDGALKHEAVLVVLPPDVAPLREQLASDSRVTVDTLAAVPPRTPRSTGLFAADLAPGRYGIICFVLDDDGVDHSSKGMSAEIIVG